MMGIKRLLIVFLFIAFNSHAQQLTLDKNFEGLQNWQDGIFLIEITAGERKGTVENPPALEFKIIQTIRPTYLPGVPNKIQGNVGAIWLQEDRKSLQNSNYDDTEKAANWNAQPTISPKAGTRGYAFITELGSEFVFIHRKNFFADTPENKLAIEQHAQYEALMHKGKVEQCGFYLTLLLPLIGIAIVWFKPWWGMAITASAFGTFWIYNSLIPSSSNIRVDLVFTLPMLGVSLLTLLVGLSKLTCKKFRAPKAK